LEQEVTEILQDEKSKTVTIKTRNGNEYESKYLIIAIPPTNWTKIKFIPDLPYNKIKVTAIVIIQMIR
jgi:monoamine oxidase